MTLRRYDKTNYPADIVTAIASADFPAHRLLEAIRYRGMDRELATRAYRERLGDPTASLEDDETAGFAAEQFHNI